MKKILRKGIRALMVPVLVLALFAGAALVTAQGVDEALVSYVDGVVDVKKAGTDWVPAEVGMTLSAGDSVRTTIDSRLDLKFKDGGVLRVDEESNMDIEELTEKAEKGRFLYFMNKDVKAKKIKFKLNEGTILANVKKLPNSQSQFLVETPKGIAGVRGTNWVIHEGSGFLGVLSGFIDWVSRGNIAKAQKGDTTLLGGIRRMISGRQVAGIDRYQHTRVNEGCFVDIDNRGNADNMRIFPEDLRKRTNRAMIAMRVPHPSLTHNQAASNDYDENVAIGEFGVGGTQTGQFDQNAADRAIVTNQHDVPIPQHDEGWQP